ncbi:hypothetical protein ID866_11185 [Astraeus odoratus]|nr:hypothetical protein ID866_11185 [Astraeus odoratus]
MSVGLDNDPPLVTEPHSDIATLSAPLEEYKGSDLGYEAASGAPAALNENQGRHVHAEASTEEHGEEHLSSGTSPEHTETTPHATATFPDSEGVDSSKHSVDTGQAGEVGDFHQTSETVYVDPPPTVLLSVGPSSEALFHLFNRPVLEASSGSTPSQEGGSSAANGHRLLLESNPTLYYEPLSSVFDALRQDDDLLSYTPHSFEGELVLDAYDLQLAVSEDNIHSREISLHDLNVLHDGSDFAGPLRLRLTATTPRFIFRFYALQEQIQRLNSSADREGYNVQEDPTTGNQQDNGEEHLEEEQSHSASDSVEQYHQPAEVPRGASSQRDTPPPPAEPAAEAPVPQPAEDTDYHTVLGEEAEVLENENEYEDTRDGDGDADDSAETVLDADQVHVSADTDRATKIPAVKFSFGGEQTDYEEYVLPEEYDERDGEDLTDDAEGDSQLDNRVQYEADGAAGDEYTFTTDVNENRAVSAKDASSDVTTPVSHTSPRAPENSFDNPNPEKSQSQASSSLVHDNNTSSEEHENGSSYQSEKSAYFIFLSR